MISHQTPSQSRAIAHGEGPAIVLAGPGSGKTFVITKRIESLIREKHIPEDQILVITFTKAAATEMKERYERGLGGRKSQITFGTFHAVFFRILRTVYHLTVDNIIREDQKMQLLTNLSKNIAQESEDPRELVENLAAEISQVKNERIPLEHFYSAVCSDSAFRDIYRQYTESMRAQRLLDFDDMLLFTWKVFKSRADILQQWRERYRYILIDEFQDINALQYEVVRMLASPCNNLFVVGDDDQSIYRFRGAKPEIMLGFPQDYPGATVLHLQENFRCRPEIVASASTVIAQNVHRFTKEVHCVRESGEPVDIRSFDTAYQEAIYLVDQVRKAEQAGRSLDEIAVLTRTNTGGRYLAEKLTEFEIPFYMEGRMPNLYDHWIAQDIFAYLRLAQGPCERKDFLRVMNRPVRYLSRDCVDEARVDFDHLRAWYEDKPWMCSRLDTLEEDLLILCRLRPYAAINYIRGGMGYDPFLREYAQERKIDEEDLLEVLDELQERSREFSQLSTWQEHIEEYRKEWEEQYRQKKERGSSIPRVTLSTLHASKGLEYQEVFLPDLNQGVLPHSKAVLEADLEEERRLLYVGMTRAKDKLHLFCLRHRYGRPIDPTPFLHF